MLPVVVELLDVQGSDELPHTPSRRLRELMEADSELIPAAIDLGAVPKLLSIMASGGHGSPVVPVRFYLYFE